MSARMRYAPLAAVVVLSLVVVWLIYVGLVDGNWLVVGLGLALLGWYGLTGRRAIRDLRGPAERPPEAAAAPSSPPDTSQRAMAELDRIRGALVRHGVLREDELPVQRMLALGKGNPFRGDLGGFLALQSYRQAEEGGQATRLLVLPVEEDHQQGLDEWVRRTAPMEGATAPQRDTLDERLAALADALAARVSDETLAVARGGGRIGVALVPAGALAPLNDDLAEAGRFEAVTPGAA